MLTTPLDDDARRAYWTAEMEKAHAFLREMAAYPVRECGEPMAPLANAVRAAGVEVAFSTLPHARGLPRLYYLRAGLIEPFLAAAREMNARGWVLKVEDGYRTDEMQRHIGLEPHVFPAILRRVQWECRGRTPPIDLLYRRVASLVANVPKVGTHMSGTALDISVLRRDTGAEVDRGGPYLEMSERTPMESPFVSAEARRNRREITALLRRLGFVAYPWEFWHYSGGDSYTEHLNATGRPARYGPVHLDPADGRVTPIENQTTPLNPPEVIRELMERALASAEGGAAPC